MSANLYVFVATTNRITDAGRVQDYFAHHFGMSSLPKYICHLTWQRGDYPKLHCLAESAKRISEIIEDDVSLDNIKPHQCSLFSRSLLGVIATLFPGYAMGRPESMDGPLHYLYGLLHAWFDFRKPNHKVLKITRNVLKELSEHPTSQVSRWRPATNMDARVASNLPIEANGKAFGTVLVHMAICKLTSFMCV